MRPLYRLRCLGKERRFTSISTGKILLATHPDVLLRFRLPFDEFGWKARPGMIFAFYAFALVNLG